MSISRGQYGKPSEFFEILKNFKKHLWGKMISRRIACFIVIRRYVSWFKLGGNQFWESGPGRIEGVNLSIFLENSKEHLWRRTRNRRVSCFIVIRWMQVGLTLREPISGVRSTEGGAWIFSKFQKTPVGNDEKKTHSMFHFDQINVSWFKIRGTNFGILCHGEEEVWIFF